MKKYLLLVVAGLIFVSGVVFAEDLVASPKAVQQKNILGEQNQVQTQTQNQIMNEGTATKVQTQEMVRANREELINAIKSQKETFKTQIEAKRNEVKQKVQLRKEELKSKIEQIKDQNKKTSLEKTTEKFQEINTRMTDHYIAVLDQIEKVLLNVKTRTDKATANGINTSSVLSKIEIAEKAISSAREAVKEQVGKVYTVNVTDEATLQKTAKETRELLKTDLTKLREVIKSTHVSVVDCATTLAQIPKIDELEISEEEVEQPLENNVVE